MQQQRQPSTAAWIQPADILLDVEARDKQHVLRLVAGALARSRDLDAARLFRALDRREQAGSTGLGDGFALPHARIAGLDRPLTLFLRTRSGIDYAAADGGLVSDLFAIVVPTDGDRQAHLELLRLIAELFSDRLFRRSLDGASTPSAAAALFRSAVSRLGASSG